MGTKLRPVIAFVLAAALSACATLYTKERDWRLPGNLGEYRVSARLNIGLFIREASISINDREVLSGRAFFWSDDIELSGSFDELSVHANCNTSSKICQVSIAGLQLPALQVE